MARALDRIGKLQFIALGTRRGMNFALLASAVFGRKGYVFSSGRRVAE